MAQTTVDSSSVSAMPGTTDIEETDVAGGTNDEQQTVTLSNADDGSFRLAFQGETTAPIDWDATASEVDSALEELNAVSAVTVTGTGPWTVTFVGTHSEVNVPEMNGDAALLEGGDLEATFTYDAANQLTDQQHLRIHVRQPWPSADG